MRLAAGAKADDNFRGEFAVSDAQIASQPHMRRVNAECLSAAILNVRVQQPRSGGVGWFGGWRKEGRSREFVRVGGDGGPGRGADTGPGLASAGLAAQQGSAVGAAGGADEYVDQQT